MGDMSCAIWMAMAGAPPIIMPVTDAQAGPYELLRGHRMIQDLVLAPRNRQGKVEYISTFTLPCPLDPGAQFGRLIRARRRVC